MRAGGTWGTVLVATVAALACACSQTPKQTTKPNTQPPPAAGLRAVNPAAPGPGLSSTLPELTDRQFPGVPTRLGPWSLVGRTEVPGPYSDQGLATVSDGGDRATIVYTGTLSVTPPLGAQGWDHAGDPDGWSGWLVTPFQAGPGGRAKMFETKSPAGVVTEWVHPLQPGELANNSFAAVTPDGLWTLSAEWGVERRLLVFPTPGVNPAAVAGRPLPLAGTLSLDQPVTDLQGCAFQSATTLLCSAPAGVLELDLAHPVGSDQTDAAAVHGLGPVPEAGGCSGAYEPEGIDIDRQLGQLRIAVSQPGICNLLTQVYEYRPAE